MTISATPSRSPAAAARSARRLYQSIRYDNDTTAWHIGRRIEEKRCADPDGRAVLDWRRYDYDPATGNLA